MARDGMIAFRDISGDLVERLDRFGEQMGVNRSAAIRMLLETGLGSDPQKAAIREAVAATGAVVRPIVQSAIASMSDQIASELDAAVGTE